MTHKIRFNQSFFLQTYPVLHNIATVLSSDSPYAMDISLFHASAFAFVVSFVSFNCCVKICCVAGVVVGGACGVSSLIC